MIIGYGVGITLRPSYCNLLFGCLAHGLNGPDVVYERVMRVFDDIERNLVGPADHLVCAFEYLNNSARPEAKRVRELIETWINAYPAEHQPRIIGRLRSRNDTLHQSAFFELFLHALLLRQGFVVVAIEPELPNGSAPDFLVKAPDGAHFYLEATLASGMNTAKAGGERRMREAIQAIDAVESPNFFLNLHTHGVPSQPIATSRLQNAVQQFVNGLNYDDAVQAAQANQLLPTTWEHGEHGARFVIQPVPKNVQRPGERAIGGRTLPGGIINPNLAIKAAVEKKASRYGDIDLPLVIAVNALEEYARPDDAIDALFGTTVVVDPAGGQPRVMRNADGAWQGPSGPVYTRSSAILFVEHLSGWSVAQRKGQLILNPWARSPVPHLPLGLEIRHVVEGRLVCEPGRPFHEIFELEEGWPE